MDVSAALASLAEAGFDLAHAFDTALVAREPGLAVLADPSRRLGVLVGNTRALWPRFLAGRDDRDDHPLDRYAERAFARAFPGERAWLGHARYDGAYLPLQRLAALVGFAYLAPTHLAIHPVFGPWFALRGVVALSGEPPPVRLPLAPPCHCADACTTALARAMSSKDPEAWVAVRDSCTVGRAHRYDEVQVRYHYVKDRSLLR